MAHRLSGPGRAYEGLTRISKKGPVWTGRVVLAEETLDLPLRWRRPKLVFVNSMSDLFHDRVSSSEIQRVFRVMREAHWHTFQVLTKRAERLHELAKYIDWPSNVWMGVSIESEKYLERADLLRSVPAAVRFLSLEPLLGPLPGLTLSGIHWVIVGGESGPGARPMDADWVREIRRKCQSAHVRFFFKQWGGVRKKAAGRTLDGQLYDEMPARSVEVAAV